MGCNSGFKGLIRELDPGMSRLLSFALRIYCYYQFLPCLIYIYIYIYTHTHIYIYIHMCVYVYTYTYLYIYIHIHAHTHTHTHMPSYLHNKSSTRLHAVKQRYEIVKLDGTNLLIFVLRYNIVSQFEVIVNRNTKSTDVPNHSIDNLIQTYFKL